MVAAPTVRFHDSVGFVFLFFCGCNVFVVVLACAHFLLGDIDLLAVLGVIYEGLLFLSWAYCTCVYGGFYWFCDV